MSNKTYPFVGWVLGGTFIPKQVEFVAHRRWYGGDRHEAKFAKDQRFEDVFETKQEAVDAGHKRIEIMKARLAKQALSIEKKRENLLKHA